MKYEESFCKKVLDQVLIVDVIKAFTKVSLKNDVYLAKCPFHKDPQGSMVIYPNKQVYHCFGCGESGNAAMFLAKIKNISFDEAIEKLAKFANIKPTKEDIRKEQYDVEKIRMYAIHKDAAVFYRQKLLGKDGEEAMSYLKERKINNQSIQTFGLGYAPGKGNALYKYLSLKGYSKEEMLKSGLVRESEHGCYDMFRKRIIFPIMNKEHKVVAFGGRVLDDSKPKYLNSPESCIFNKGEILYGIHDVGSNKQYFVLCEGNLDVIALHQAGIKNSIATLGTSFTTAHAHTLSTYTKNVVISFDNDEAGQKAALRTMSILKKKKINAKVLSMYPYKDPDEFIKKLGVKEYQGRIKKSIDPLDFQLNSLVNTYDFKQEEAKMLFLRNCVDLMIQNK